MGNGARVGDIGPLGVVAAGAGACAWMMASTLVPVYESGTNEYMFLSASFTVWGAFSAAVLGLLAVVHVMLLEHDKRAAPGLLALLSRTAYVAPLALLPMTLLSLILLGGRISPTAQVITYFFVDLRGVFLLAVGALFILALGQRLGFTVRPVEWRAPVWGAYAGLVLVVTAFGLVSSPNHRYESIIVGDEPKYLRYLESFYQGHGFDMSQRVSFEDFSVGSVSRVHQLGLLLQQSVLSARDMARESSEWMRGAGDGLVNRAAHLSDWFICTSYDLI